VNGKRQSRLAIVARPGDIRFETRTVGPPGPEEVLVQIRATGLCGSDLHTIKGLHPDVKLPTAIGHEFAGEIIACGTKVRDYRAGDRVSVEPLLTCGQCYFCLRGEYLYCPDLKVQYRIGQGALGDYFVTPQRWLHRIPDGLSYEEASLAEPVAVALHAARRSGVGPGDHVAVFGCGTIGLLIIQAARALGAAMVYGVDVLPNKLAAAEAMGARPIDGSRVDIPAFFRAGPRSGLDRTFEAVGLQSTLTDALNSLRRGGVLTVVGIFEKPDISLHAQVFSGKELSVVGSCAYTWDFSESLALMADGRIKVGPLITHVLPLTELPGVMRLFEDRRNPPIKVVFHP